MKKKMKNKWRTIERPHIESVCHQEWRDKSWRRGCFHRFLEEKSRHPHKVSTQVGHAVAAAEKMDKAHWSPPTKLELDILFKKTKRKGNFDDPAGCWRSGAGACRTHKSMANVSIFLNVKRCCVNRSGPSAYLNKQLLRPPNDDVFFFLKKKKELGASHWTSSSKFASGGCREADEFFFNLKYI